MSGSLLSLVVVSFNTRDLLRDCLHSLVVSQFHEVGNWEPATANWRDSSAPPTSSTGTCTPGDGSEPTIPVEVVVVDNASQDGSSEMVDREFPMVRLVTSSTNLGFASAANIGLRHCSGDLFLLLNPDTRVVGDALPEMASFLNGDDRVGAVGPALIYPDGTLQHGAFRFPTLLMSFLDFFPLNHRLINSRLNGRYRLPSDKRPVRVDHPLGAALMLRREAVEDVGLLDEDFFMYCEEVDWCIRARRRGWQIYQLPSATIIHHSGQSSMQFGEKMFVELHRSRYRLFRKHYSSAFVRTHKAITRAGLLKSLLRARWLRLRGRIGGAELESQERAFRAVWDM